MGLLAGMIAAALGVSALAANMSGLHAFLNVNSYVSGKFTDVTAGSWFESGVKTVFEKGIMRGVSETGFAPHTTVTWGQAVTIAARLHAAYHGAEIRDSEGAWYAAYTDYAEKTGILPSTVPEKERLSSAVVSRQELAALFHNVLSERDLPRINDRNIPDLQDVLPEFRDAVQALYAAGIFTGRNDGSFDPTGQATRAEIAVVVTRLLSPGQRQSFDTAKNEIMSKQWGNYKNGGFAVQCGDVIYYTVRERADSEHWKYSIIARNDHGETQKVYETSYGLTRLAASDDGCLYFIENKNVLMSLDPENGQTMQRYKSSESIEHFVSYDGQIYILECYAKALRTEDWKFRIGRVEKNSLAILVNNIPYDKAKHLDILHAFQGKLYYSFGEENYTSGGRTFYKYTIWSLDLETKKTARAFAGDLCMGDVCFDGATCWYFRENESGSYEIVRGNLLMPEYEEVLTVLPDEALELYPNLFANGSRLFFQSSNAAKIWEIDPAGEVREFAQLPGEYYERACVTRQGTIIHALPSLSALLPHQIPVLLPNGNWENYLQFMNLPYWKIGKSLYEVTGEEIFWEDHVVTDENITTVAERAYYTSEEDLVIELSICNGSKNTIRPVAITLVLSDGEREVTAVFYVPEEIAAGTETVVSAVVTAEQLQGVFSLSSMKKSVSLKYN